MWRRFIPGGCLLLLWGVGLVSGLGEYSRTVSYEGDIVVRCTDKLKGTIQLLHDSTDEWNVGEDTVDLRMPRKTFARVQKYVPECQVLIENVEEHIRKAEAQMFPARLQEEEAWAKMVLENVLKTKPTLAECQAAIESWEKARVQEGSSGWFEEYHNYDAIVLWYQQLAETHPDLVHYVESIGKSHLGLDMPAVHITASTNPDRHKIYFQCQIHAREWISGAVCMYLVNELVKNFEANDPKVASILGSAELIVVPFVNPDGYVYTWTGDRLWRKNRRIVESQIGKTSPCVGVDINRNFPEGWQNRGKSKPIECAEDYGGPSPKSEPETRHIIHYWNNNGPIVGAIDWHSYSQLILHPWAWTNKDAKHEEQVQTLGQEMSDIIKGVHGKLYKSEKSIDLYQCYGIASDWFFSDDACQNNKGYRAASYVVELRDTGDAGFLLPPDQIIPTGEEIYPAVIHFMESLLDNPIPCIPMDAMVQDEELGGLYSSRLQY